mgnify:CR=1 FL=1
MWANILYVIIGLVVGVAVTCFLVVPGIKARRNRCKEAAIIGQ